jgi:DNA-directed RNA polymerase subunit RPC12/RpoP
MSVVETIKSVVGSDDSPNETRYRCGDCGNEFTSYKDPERVSCRDCVSREVEPVETH